MKETIKSFLHLVADVECFEFAVGRVLLCHALRAICPDHEAAPAKIGSAITSLALQIRHQDNGLKKHGTDDAKSLQAPSRGIGIFSERVLRTISPRIGEGRRLFELELIPIEHWDRQLKSLQ